MSWELHKPRWVQRYPCEACGRLTSRWFVIKTVNGGHRHAHCMLKGVAR